MFLDLKKKETKNKLYLSFGPTEPEIANESYRFLDFHTFFVQESIKYSTYYTPARQRSV